MKTFWSGDYLFRKYGGRGTHNFLREKCAAYEEKTGVPWTSYSVAGGYALSPHLPYREWRDRQNSSPAAVAAVYQSWKRLARVTGYVGFLDLANDSGLDLPTVLGVSRYLSEKTAALLNISRNGRIVSLKIDRDRFEKLS